MALAWPVKPLISPGDQSYHDDGKHQQQEEGHQEGQEEGQDSLAVAEIVGDGYALDVDDEPPDEGDQAQQSPQAGDETKGVEDVWDNVQRSAT